MGHIMRPRCLEISRHETVLKHPCHIMIMLIELRIASHVPLSRWKYIQCGAREKKRLVKLVLQPLIIQCHTDGSRVCLVESKESSVHTVSKAGVFVREAGCRLGR